MKLVNQQPTQEMLNAALPIFGEVAEMSKQDIKTLKMDLEFVWRTMYAAAPNLSTKEFLGLRP